MRRLPAVYQRFLLSRPWTVLVVLALLLAFFSYHSQDFRLDASADSLLLEDDKDLHLLREINARYQSQDLLIVTFSPTRDLFSDDSLAHLRRLRDELRELDSIDSVVTILDVPLVTSSDIPLTQMADNVPTLQNPSIDRQRARLELSKSPVYNDLVISGDTQTTALLVNLKGDQHFASLLRTRGELLAKRRSNEPSREKRQQLQAISVELKEIRASLSARRHEDIGRIRLLLDKYRTYGVLHLGGVPMIADDMVTFVRNDLIVFGSGAFALLVVVLSVIFRRVRWVMLPLLSCFYAAMTMIGLLGLIGWEVTVISSNFLALLLIITISMSIHLVVRYRQLLRDAPDETHPALVSSTLQKMVWPCLYTALTTIIGFSSLVFSDIKPVIDFGWMMSLGLAVAFLTSFSLFPAALLVIGKPKPDPRRDPSHRLAATLAHVTERHGTAILLTTIVLAATSAFGISRLTVENSFIDYFRKDTEIYQGMKLIDEQLGGTTPLEILLNWDANGQVAEQAAQAEEVDEEYDEFDEWEIDVASGPEYWFTPFKIERIKEVHDYLDGLSEVGKVLSLASVIRVAEELNDGEEFDGLELSVLYKRVPDAIRERMIDPYFSFEHNEARIQLRILDSRRDLRRKELLDKIRDGLTNQLQLSEGDVTVTGTLVLYNNMLQSLYASQISSLGAVMAGIAIMLFVLFRSVPLAIIGIVPNVLAAGIVLGLMGLVGIPLDIMTITVAAITIGIAVDNAIHYIYRFREEFARSGDYIATLQVCHSNIGRAILHTSMTIIFGFSILALSNFFPTVYFGALTGLAMCIALLAALTLLPRLILIWRPFD
jgi:predicted RND superfamily exporter protein